MRNIISDSGKSQKNKSGGWKLLEAQVIRVHIEVLAFESILFNQENSAMQKKIRESIMCEGLEAG